MQRLRTITLLDVSAVAGHHAMPAALLFNINTSGFFLDIFDNKINISSKMHINEFTYVCKFVPVYGTVCLVFYEL